MKIVQTIGLAILLVFLNTCSPKFKYKSLAKTNAELPGQTAPPDMIFIEGDDSIEPFYIGIIEEPNINYIMYLKWICRVHLSTPEVFFEALPKSSNNQNGVYINEPYLQNSMLNPYCAYYPVTNLTWTQIQRYLQWKTDRLNEMILINTRFVKKELDNQSDDWNFNTEAFMLKHYDPILRLAINRPETDYHILFEDGILFTGFRLPTKNEWMLANQKSAQPITIEKRKPIKAINHPFGDSHFLLSYNWYPEESFMYESEANPILLYDIRTQAYDKTKTPLNKNIDSTTQYWMTSIYDYPAKAKGTLNMSNGVSEWLLNDSLNPNAQWLEAYQKSGFKVKDDAIYHNKSDSSIEKDSLGRMKHFRYIDSDENGPIPVSILPNKDSSRKRMIIGGDWQNPGTQIQYLPEDSFGTDVGFRCVLPYTGTRVYGNFKVKWK